MDEKQRDNTTLWAIHVQGPDSIIAQPNRETAERRAKEWQSEIDAFVASRPPIPYAPVIKHVVIPYGENYECWRAEIDEHGGDPEDHC